MYSIKAIPYNGSPVIIRKPSVTDVMDMTDVTDGTDGTLFPSVTAKVVGIMKPS